MVFDPLQILANDGPIARRLGGDYELRPQQIAMVEAVAKTLKTGGKLLVEAGTGVGKSFAYLLPALASIIQEKPTHDNLATARRKRIVISTHTIALQEQLINKDIPLLRAVVPENRLRVYDTRAALHGLADAGSVLELRSGFGLGIHTALARIEGRAVGVLANNPHHLGGAIDADAADKAARFMQLCNAHSLPLVSLVDTPGFMVGPDTEATAQVRHVSRMFIAAAHLRVPYLSVVLRKGYGLGAMAMTAGGFHAPLCTVAWPSAEFGAMGLEGAVRLGFKKELEAVPEGAERDALFAQLLAQHVDKGSALAMASSLEIDAVIDPADTRAWLVRGLAAGRVGALRGAAIDTW